MKQTKHLTTIAKSTYLGRELCKGKRNKTLGMFKEYLDRIDDVMDKAISDHPRTTVIRVDLKFPCTIKYEIAQVMKRFISSLSAQINADIKKKRKEGKRTPDCNVRYVWARENNLSLNDHYHVALFFNKDVYMYLGRFTNTNNLAYRIKRAWCSALDLDIDEGGALVHFPDNSQYWLDRRANNFDDVFNQVFKRLSYFAKTDTKKTGDRRRNFGYSLR
ncbi:inovirus Gp2 family protein [Vibrio sp. A8-1]|uniref:inovirus Gp2 family protein n=1 Tax=Vibrio sp. A8-1 TaxID=2591023 RepID=UPI001482450F|nr:inovirus Gp2 family protein [Vibrio sp. A8-1]NNN85163.1 inovirus Gp2 family protein [Vibrio sp. A8-1]